MSIVTLHLLKVKRTSETRPKICPHCQGKTFQCWGQTIKPVKDSFHRTIRSYRYRCCHCRHTFRHYPEGVDRADQTQRLRKLAAGCARDQQWLRAIHWKDEDALPDGARLQIQPGHAGSAPAGGPGSSLVNRGVGRGTMRLGSFFRFRQPCMLQTLRTFLIDFTNLLCYSFFNFSGKMRTMMAIGVQKLENAQQVEVAVSGPNQIGRMFILTGDLRIVFGWWNDVERTDYLRYTLGPKLRRGEFVRAIALVSLSDFTAYVAASETENASWRVENADADWDDETNQVQLTAGLTVSRGAILKLSYHITVLAKDPQST